MDAKFRVNFPPDPNPRRPKFSPPPGTCDTHFHIFGPPHLFPYADSRQFTPPAAPIEHYLSVAGLLGIERGVLVQSAAHGTDTAATLDAVAKAGGRLRGVIRADPSLTGPDYETLHRGGVRGVRITLIAKLGGAFEEDVFMRILAAIAPFGWVACLHLNPEGLEQAADAIRRAPVPVVIDHFGHLDARAGPDQPAFRLILDVLGETHVWIKISGANRLTDEGAAFAQVVPLARALIARAPDRVIWGSDWPHTDVFEAGLMPNDGDLLDMMMEFAPDESVRNRILAENPARLFGF